VVWLITPTTGRMNPIEWKFQSCVRPSVLVYDYHMGFIRCCKMGDYGLAATQGGVVDHGRGAGGEWQLCDMKKKWVFEFVVSGGKQDPRVGSAR